MVRKQDQEHVKALLTEAITVLCKNGLGFQSQLNIEALIGITLDKEEVFLVSINETVIARNTRVSSVLELSCEDVCHRDCPEFVPQVTSRPQVGPVCCKRPKVHKRKYSGSSSIAKPPELEKITKTISSSGRGEPVEKRVRSGVINNNKECQKKTRSKEISTSCDNENEEESEQHTNKRKCLNTAQSEENSNSSKYQANVQSGEKNKSSKHQDPDEPEDQKEPEDNESGKRPKAENHELRKVCFMCYLC